MKKSLLMFLLLGAVALSGCAGMKTAENANQPIEIILDASGKTQRQLYSSAKSWMAETRIARLRNILDADKDSGRIIISGIADFPCDGFACISNKDIWIKFSLRIDTKDGKIKMTYTNLIKSYPQQGSTLREDFPVYRQDDFDAANNGARALSNELLLYATKQSASNKW